jgi:multicomponent Na+:H+ antiporter subunit E
MRLVRHLVLFAILLAFWQLLSGRLDPLFIGLGVVSSAVVTLAAGRGIERTIGSAESHPRVRVLRLVPFALWLLQRMIASAAQIAYIVINPRVPPEPGIVRLPCELRSPAARAVLANSITLVPGTMTLEMTEHEITVHSFTPDAVEDLATAEMQNRIAAAFGDVEQRPPRLVWESGHTPEGMHVAESDRDHVQHPDTDERTGGEAS